MLDDDTTVDTTSPTDNTSTEPTAASDAAPPAKKAAKKAPAKKAAAKKAPAKKAAAKKVAASPADADVPLEGTAEAPTAEGDEAPATRAAKKAPAKKAAKKAPAKKAAPKAEAAPDHAASGDAGENEADAGTGPGTMLLFQAPEPTKAPARAKKAAAKKSAPKAEVAPEHEKPTDEASEDDTEAAEEDDSPEGAARRRRRRGGRRRRKPGNGEGGEDAETGSDADASGEGESADDTEQGEGGSTRRRRVRARAGEQRAGAGDDPANTVTRVRQGRSAEDEIAGFSGSTRLEAKKQRRREGREAGRRRAPIISEAEFLARRESVDRVMVIRQRKDLTQIAVLEDKVLVEHYVARESQTSLIGNVYLGRVQNVLPSMEAAFIDIGKGRNAVLYAGEVNWDALGAKDGSQRKIEAVLKPGQAVLVQVTKDPVGHKGARLTSQVSLPGRFLVYVPDGTTSGISRKLPDTERNRLKTLLKEIVPETAGVIVRTAAEGASEEELTRDVERLTARWEDISKKVEGGNAPALLYGEPDLTLKVVRDLFTEDFSKLVISGNDAWDTVREYVENVAPDLAERVEKHDDTDGDAFAEFRIDEQIAKGLDRKVWLPSGGSLIIDRTEAMTVVDVNTGKFTGSGGNLEETVTKNNLEAAEEIVRQLRLRDIGGIIVVDFIDMVLESNRDLVLRRLVECLGRDRTRHQVAEVTSLGLVQMTRKRIGTGLLEAFSETCEHCGGRGLLVHHEPIEPKKKVEEEPRRARRSRGRGKGGSDEAAPTNGGASRAPSPADLAAFPRHEESEHETPVEDVETPAEDVETPADEATTAPEASEAPEAPEEAEPEQPEARAGDDPAATAAEEPAAEAAEEPAAEAAEEPAPAAPAAPKIVTSTRRVSARRAAGPPKPVESDGARSEVEGTAEGAGETLEIPELDHHEPAAPAHVPIKKKGGARKR
ncbi:MAG TPA: Rne/Rng family ribonuclease [Nocardioidaceae bacterium]|nr:Rne/Rng family ribonuclease [Nocardioidaceae bacterium]